MVVYFIAVVVVILVAVASAPSFDVLLHNRGKFACLQTNKTKTFAFQ